ncbi:MAG TPA: dTDP-4-dehydrorhamnose 3,5-epimerase [Gaiellaceae bacterium]
MKFVETPLRGAYVLELERFEDERGFFARTFCEDEFRARGLDPRVAQCNVSFNEKNGTLRGMHYQAAPHDETKLVRCTMGAIHDVVVDLRRDSVTYRKAFAVELAAQNRLMLYIPTGFAHGFITLTDHTEMHYQMSKAYAPGSRRGFRWDDPTFAVEWPRQPSLLSAQDAAWPPFVASDAPF